MEKYIELSKKLCMIVDDDFVFDMRKLDMGKKVLITILFDKEEK